LRIVVDEVNSTELVAVLSEVMTYVKLSDVVLVISAIPIKLNRILFIIQWCFWLPVVLLFICSEFLLDATSK
jgi:hypothetical protein